GRLLRGERGGHEPRDETVVLVGDEHPHLGDSVPLAERERDQAGEEERKAQRGEETERRSQLPLEIFRDQVPDEPHQSRSSRPVKFRNSVFRLGGWMEIPSIGSLSAST